MQRCMSCLENYPRRQVCLCQGCKGWYCPECQTEHTPCNEERPVEDMEVEDETTDEDEIDDSKPGIWIIKMPEATQVPFNIWNYVKDASDVKIMLPSYNW